MNIRPLLDDGTTRPVSPWPSTSEDTTSFIIRRAMELVNELVKYRGQEEPPFLAEELAHLQGIKVTKEDLGEVGAFLIRSPDGYTIKVNANHHPVKQNYSCAHEIGHTFLHELDRLPNFNDLDDNEFKMSNSNVVGKAKERLCQIAAAEILMPELVFKRYLAEFGVTVNSIRRLAQIFKVSFPAAAIRITEVNLEPCIAIIWKPWQKTKSKGFQGRFMQKPIYIRNPSSLLKAYECDNDVKSFKSLDINGIKKRCLMESKGFGQGKTRYIISLVFLER